MSLSLTLPPAPRAVPSLTVDPGSIRRYAADLLAASAQLDDLGSFVAGAARIGDWSGVGSAAYHDAIRPTGHRADALSLALRAVSRRVDAHAEAMQELLGRRTTLEAQRAHLVSTISGLRARAAAVGDVADLEAECAECAADVRRHEVELDRWLTDRIAEEEAMRAAFERVLTLDQVERRYGGVADPADRALDRMPAGDASPGAVKAWWDGLTRDEQLAIIAASPGSIGNRDGIPAWARDAANTVALDRDLAEWGHLEALGALTDEEARWLENARSAHEALQHVAREGRDLHTGDPLPTQLYLYDPAAFGGDGAVAISVGETDTADNVAVVVPGFGTDAGSAPYQAERALTLHEAARTLDPGQTNASMFWIGYDAPDNPPWEGDGDWSGVLDEEHATRGGERLADLFDGLRASRDGEPAHLTAIGHSYGSTTTGHAAHDHGIPVDDLVFVGSPGVGGDTDHVSDTGVDADHVWAAANSRDPIADLGNHGAIHLEVLGGGGLGDDPAEDDFGGQRLRAESTTRAEDARGLDSFEDHDKYFDHDTESLWNISQVVNGNYGAVDHAGHVHDPFLGGPEDPESDRDPTAPDTDGLP